MFSVLAQGAGMETARHVEVSPGVVWTVQATELYGNCMHGDCKAPVTLDAISLSRTLTMVSGIPPFAETREYVRRVLRFYDSYRGNGLTSIQRLRQ